MIIITTSFLFADEKFWVGENVTTRTFDQIKIANLIEVWIKLDKNKNFNNEIRYELNMNLIKFEIKKNVNEIKP